jgi:hypothetical protein
MRLGHPPSPPKKQVRADYAVAWSVYGSAHFPLPFVNDVIPSIHGSSQANLFEFQDNCGEIRISLPDNELVETVKTGSDC